MSSTIADTGARLSDSPGPPCASTSGTPEPRVSVHKRPPPGSTGAKASVTDGFAPVASGRARNGGKAALPASAQVERRLALGDREAPLVERLADDHAREVDLAQRGEAAQVLERADPARVDEPS